MEDLKFDSSIKFQHLNCEIGSLRIPIVNETIRIQNIVNQTNLNSASLCASLFNLSKMFNEVEIVTIGKDWWDFYQYCEVLFGLSKKTVQHYIQVYNKFVCSVDGTYTYMTMFENFNISKLCELCSVSMDQLERDIENHKLSSGMTQKRIREYVKSLKGTENKENQVLEEPTQEDKVEIDYNPNKHHDRKYFESLSKEELVEIVLQLQDCYESLLEDDDE